MLLPLRVRAFVAILSTVWSLLVLAAAEEISLKGAVPPEVQEIEIVHVEGRAPTVSLKAAAASDIPPPFRPSGPTVDLLSLLAEVRSFGGCKSQTDRRDGVLTLSMKAPRKRVCGHLLAFQRDGVVLDALSHDTLHLRGETSGPMTLALVDEAARRREDNFPLTRVTGRFDLRISLAPAARRVDLRYLVSLVVLPEAKINKVTLETLALERAVGPRQTAPAFGFWVWEYRRALADQEALLGDCRSHGCGRILVQMPALEDPEELWRAYAQFLSTAQGRGIEAFALDGYPEAINAPAPLADKVRRLVALMAGQRLGGVQLDIEPYLLEDFFMDETGYVRYLAAIDHVKEALGGRARLSVVMPFWFTSQRVNGRPVAFSVIDRADEVAIMSYRTDVYELQAIAEDPLRYGDVAGVPVWLAVETRPLPLERRVVLKRESRRDLANAYLDRGGQRLILQPPPSMAGLDWFRVDDPVTVRPERITFAGQTRQQVRAAVTAILDAVRNPSLAGVLIHDLHGFTVLPE